MSTETKPKRTRRKSSDTTLLIDQLRKLTFIEKKDVAISLNAMITEQADAMRAEAEATLKLIGG